MSAPFRLSIPDPAFDPRREVLLNGFLYLPALDVPARELAEALQCECEADDQAEMEQASGRVGDFLAGIAFAVIAMISAWGLAGWIGSFAHG